MDANKVLTRPSKTDYYLTLARDVASRSTCLRRKYGAVIVRNDTIVSTGYNGSPRGCINCSETGVCMREELNVPAGERYELCRSIHAEQNAMMFASLSDMNESAMYLTGVDAKTGEILAASEPCLMCKKMLINSGIKMVIARGATDENNGVTVVEYRVQGFVKNINA